MEDFLLLEEELLEEERLIRNSIREFVDEKVIPLMANAYENAQFPHQLISEFADLGLFGLTLPT